MSTRFALKAAFQARRVSQYEIAERLGITETRLSRIVRGRVKPTPAERKRLSKILRVGEDELFEVER